MPAPKGNQNALKRPGQRKRGAPEGQPRAPGAGRPKQWRDLRIAEADAQLLEEAIGNLALEDALRRIAASVATDHAVAAAQLAPLLAEAAWDGKEML